MKGWGAPATGAPATGSTSDGGPVGMKRLKRELADNSMRTTYLRERLQRSIEVGARVPG
jgi:hypothetical protein